MKILQLLQRPQLRGAEIFACQLSAELKKSGHEVDILFLFDNPSNPLDYDLKFICLHANPSGRFTDIKAYRRLATIIEDGHYDLVQANAGDTLKYAALSKLLFRWKVPLVFRNANKMSAFIRSGWHKILNALFISQADYIISVSENCRQDLATLFSGTAHRSGTVTIGTDTRAGRIASKLPDKTVWINVGSFVAEKNHAFLLALFAKCRSGYANPELWLVGDGKLNTALRAQARQLGVQDRVKFWGYRNDAVELIGQADVMVMPSLIEGLPGVILEAQYCKTPVVAYNVGGISEVIENGKTGWLVEKDDEEGFANAVEDVLNGDKERVNKIGENAYRQVVSKFDNKVVAEKFMETYRKIAT